MQKVTFICLLILLTTACSVFINNTQSDNKLPKGNPDEQSFEGIEKQNITSNSFYIQKAEIEIRTPEKADKLLGSIKFEKPDKYLISIKSKTGIEIVRIFINKDSVLVNDRINKKMYYDSTGHIKLKYGISVSEIPLVFGDFVRGNSLTDTKISCKSGSGGLSVNTKGTRINYEIDCLKAKVRETVIMNSISEAGLSLLFSSYLKESEGLMPGLITMNYLQRDIIIEIKIRKIETPWEGSIDFIPGKNYEILQLP